jgi:thiamine-phosphate diphosphorylase/hydroxyethylthiazole kinase
MERADAANSKMNLALYLVTDSTPALLGHKDLAQVVEAAIRGGVTIVQYRDKHSDTGVLMETARKLLDVTRRHHVPLLINDRVDVCMAVGADGVHIGQDDMHITEARRLLGSDAIIGVSTNDVEEAQNAISSGADYLGIGTMFATNTKTNIKSIIGTRGLQAILKACQTGTKHRVGCVAIGSIKPSNLQRVIHQGAYDGNYINGVAVVSAIIAAADPQRSAEELRTLVESAKNSLFATCPPGTSPVSEVSQLLRDIPAIIKKHATSSVLCHNMTNTVVQNFAANVCLATGSSPIMSLNGPEAADLASLGGGLVINMGTVTPDLLSTYLLGMQAYNAASNPIIFDPVGGGATNVRRAAIKQLLAGGFFDIIKGNEGEISAVLGTRGVQQRGVDSGPSTRSTGLKADMVTALAQRERCVVLMTGETDILSDGDRTYGISNGSHWLGKITGSGCALGSVLASYLAVYRTDKLLAALAGILHYEIAAERAADRDDVKGPGSFIPAFLDELYHVRKIFVDGGDVYIDKRAKIQTF